MSRLPLTSVTEEAVQQFSRLLRRHLGLSLLYEPQERLRAVLEQRIRSTGNSGPADYLLKLERAESGDPELAMLANVFAVSESYFFRNSDAFLAISEHVLPALRLRRPLSRPLRFLSAGCATGEEPYSLAILLQEYPLPPSRKVNIEALDASPKLIAKARSGRYSNWSFRELDVERRNKWFREEAPGRWMLATKIRESVEFWQHNLLDPLPQSRRTARFDLILFRNVLIYFTEEARKRALRNLRQALAPDGFLFLGHAESAFGKRHLGDGFTQHRFGEVFYFEGRPGGARTGQSIDPIPRDSLPPHFSFSRRDSRKKTSGVSWGNLEIPAKGDGHRALEISGKEGSSEDLEASVKRDRGGCLVIPAKGDSGGCLEIPAKGDSGGCLEIPANRDSGRCLEVPAKGDSSGCLAIPAKGEQGGCLEISANGDGREGLELSENGGSGAVLQTSANGDNSEDLNIPAKGDGCAKFEVKSSSCPAGSALSLPKVVCAPVDLLIPSEKSLLEQLVAAPGSLRPPFKGISPSEPAALPDSPNRTQLKYQPKRSLGQIRGQKRW